MDFVKKNLEEGFDDSKKDRDVFVTEKESAQFGIVTLATLLLVILLSLFPFIEFNQIVLFIILTEVIAIKDMLRKSLTRVR